LSTAVKKPENNTMQLEDPTLLKNKAYLNGQWVEQAEAATFEVTNPANGEVITTVPDLGQRETQHAIEAANDAWPAWRAKTGKARAIILRRWFDLVMLNQSDLAKILSWEQGKPLAEAMGEIAYGASFIEWFGEEAKRTYGDIIPNTVEGRRLLVI